MRLAMTGIVRTLTFAALFVWAASSASHAQTAFSEQKLEAFVTAAVAVTELSEQWKQRIGEAGSEEKAEELRAQATVLRFRNTRKSARPRAATPISRPKSARSTTIRSLTSLRGSRSNPIGASVPNGRSLLESPG